MRWQWVNGACCCCFFVVVAAAAAADDDDYDDDDGGDDDDDCDNDGWGGVFKGWRWQDHTVGQYNVKFQVFLGGKGNFSMSCHSL